MFTHLLGTRRPRPRTDSTFYCIGVKVLADKVFGKGKTTDKQREQATDGLRGLYEKFTGCVSRVFRGLSSTFLLTWSSKKVNPKYSN